MWIAYFSTRPMPEERADMRAAIVAHTMASHWTTSDKAIPIEPFLVVKPPREKHDGDMLLAMARSVTGALQPLNKKKDDDG